MHSNKRSGFVETSITNSYVMQNFQSITAVRVIAVGYIYACE